MATTTDTTEAKLTAAADAVHFSGDLDELVDNLNALENLCREHGVQAEAYLDLQHLPVFGSDKPGLLDNHGLLDVWSWDDECVLKHDGCRADGGWYTEFRDVQVA
jgi:hypothetical protein